MGKIVSFETKGKLNRTWRFLRFLSSKAYYNKLDHFAKKGVVALETATPFETGEAASSWGYNIEITDKQTTITWTNDDTTKEGTPIVLLVNYGHASRNGTWVEGYDFIGPAIQPVFDDIKKSVWKEVENA